MVRQYRRVPHVFHEHCAAGFNYLLAIALIFYALSAVSRRSAVGSMAAAA
jgi:hypothetical protein